MTDEHSDRIDAARVEMAEVRASIDLLVDALLASAPRDERRFRLIAGLLVIGGPLLFAFTLAFAVKTTVDGNNRSEQLRRGVACLLADLDDHRHTNQYAHEKMAEADHVEIHQPDIIPLTREQAAKLKAACEPYVRAAVGNAQPPPHAEAERNLPHDEAERGGP
jgi:hypothetical protein